MTIHFTFFDIFRIILAIVLPPGCVTAPVTHRTQLMLVSDAQMAALGEQAYEELTKEHKEVNDPKLVAAVREVGMKLAHATGEDYKWEFKILDSADRNAVCLPGGKIAVYRGIFDVAPTNAAIAAILGHEIAHAIAHHAAERVSQALVAQGVLAVVDVSMGDAKYHNLIMAALGAGVQLGVILPYSRKHEAEADHMGTLYVAKSGYDPKAAVQVWEAMAAQQKTDVPTFLSTHPHSKERIESLNNKMDEYEAVWRQSAKVETVNLPMRQ